MCLSAQAQSFDNADGGNVLRVQPRENPVQAEGVEAQIDDDAYRLGRIALAGIALAGIGRTEDIADLGLERGLVGKFQADLA
jgi:hypothetical protein